MSGYTVTTSSELMENYMQADILLPEDELIALQTEAGTALLCSIGPGGVFNLTIEVPGDRYGWRRVDLSSARIKQDFPAGGTCKTFGAAQAVGVAGQPRQIHLAMVINDGTNDHLYISLANSDSDLAWVDAPAWTPCPYNAVDGSGTPRPAPSPFEIAGVFVGEATDKEYVVVDTIRNPTEPVGVLARYYLDDSTPTAPTWVLQDLGEDIQAAGYASCLGRAARAFGVDGLYTKGQIGPSAQLSYTPLYNVFSSSAPSPLSALALPGALLADAIAAARNTDNTSDLYIAAQGGLYYFASSNQGNGAVGQLVFSSALLTGVRALYADVTDGIVTVWGLNGNDAVFYLTCPQAQVTSADAWNVPVSIMSGVDAIAPFVNRAYSANTFFAHATNALILAVKSPSTGLWTQRSITLPPSDTFQDAAPISSYTTHIRVTDADGNAAANVPATLTATSVTAVYINHLYYVVGPTPVQVSTDMLGTITIVEAAHTLAGTRFSVTVDQQPAQPINPMDTVFQRNAQYTTAISLQGAQIVNDDGTTRAFIPDGTSPDDLTSVAYSNQCLAKAYAGVTAASGDAVVAALASAAPSGTNLVGADIVDGILVDVGDLFSWLESGIESVIKFVEDAASGLWHFVAQIGGQIYHGVLDGVEKVVAAVTWVYNAIKIAVEDIIKFLQFLFNWQDILTTHRVLKNVFLQLAQHAIDSVATINADIASLFSQVESEIDSWANIPNFDQTPSSARSANPPLAGQNSAPANLGLHHFQGNCAASTSDLSPLGPAESIFQDLIDMVNQEETTLSDAVNAVKTQIIDQYASLSLTDIIKRLVAVIADTLLESTKNLITTLLDILDQLLTGVVDILKSKINFPVLSWLYHRLSGDDLSFIDVLCLIAAIPVTIIYKAAGGAAPFPQDDPFTTGLLAAQSFSDVQACFSAPPALVQATGTSMAVAAAAAAPVLDQSKLKTFGIVTGIATFVGAPALIVVSNLQRAADEASPLPFPKTLATVGCLANIVYVSPNLATLVNLRSDSWYGQVNNAVTLISILKGMAAIPAASSTRKWVSIAFAGVETALNVLWNIPVIANAIYNADEYDSTYQSLIPESIGNFMFNIGGMMELMIALMDDPKVKWPTAGVQAAVMLGYVEFIIMAGGIYRWAPNQQH